MADAMDALMAKAQRGEDHARDELLETVRRAVMRYLYAHHCSRADAEDIAQDVCIAVLNILPRWRDTGRSVWGAVFTITRNKLVDNHRRRVRRPADVATAIDAGDLIDVHTDDVSPEDQVIRLEGTARMARLLEQLPQRQREVLILRVVVGLDTAETAQALGLAHGSVHVLQHRAVTKLRTLLQADRPGADS